MNYFVFARAVRWAGTFILSMCLNSDLLAQVLAHKYVDILSRRRQMCSPRLPYKDNN